MNAVIYARYSSSGQREESITGQLRECNAYAKRNGYTVINEYTDSALTGTSDKRPAFQRMISDAKTGNFSAVIVWKLDRFARNRYDAAMYRNELKKAGVRIISAMENISESPEGIILEGLMESLAEYYSANLSENIKRGLYDSALERKMTFRTFGYRRGADGRYEIDPVSGPIVRRCFEEYAAGKPMPAIIEDLNADGVRTAKGREFRRNSLRAMLRNEKYKGVYRYRDVYDEHGIPPIVTPELFDKVQKELAVRSKSYTKRKTKTGATYLLTGKLYCGHCLSPMAGDSARSRHGTIYHWYSCPRNRYKPKTCEKRRVPKDWIESEVLRILNTEILTDEFIERAADAAVEYEKRFDNNSELDGLRLELKQTETKIKNVSAAIATGVITKTLPEMLAELERQREQIETAIAKKTAGVQEFSRDAVVAYLRELKALSHKDAGSQRQLLNACIKSIYVFDTDNPDELKLVINMNYFDNDAEINHSEIVRIVSAPLHLHGTSRTLVHGRRLLLIRTIKKRPADETGRSSFPGGGIVPGMVL